MPAGKQKIENTLVTFYRLVCNDTTIPDCYVGSTCNFRARKSKHKSNCINLKCLEYKFQVYEFIRAHGGWENWSMVPVGEVVCLNQMHRYAVERDFHEMYHASLNSRVSGTSYERYTQRLLDKLYEHNDCACGGVYQSKNKSIHESSQRHIKWLANQNSSGLAEASPWQNIVSGGDIQCQASHT
jgi:predicted GIY-YIG superfamily endonuclease